MEKVIMSDSPHIRGKRTTKTIMLDVIIALLPATVMGCIYFGWDAFFTILISVAASVVSEVVYRLICKEKPLDIVKTFDFTSVVTGLLLALTLPSSVPWYVPLLSAMFAIIPVKMLFGGTGKNIVNPAITGRVFAFIAFQSAMVSGWVAPTIGALNGDVVSGATQLTSMLNGNGYQLSLADMFLGTGMAGCIGETCKLALIVGGIYLVVRKVIKWQFPVIYILVEGLTAVAIAKFDFAVFMPSILSGGLILGAIFMATDYVTSPNSTAGNYVYFVALGLVTAILRAATKIEVVSFAILLMNLLVPLINAYIRPRPFGAPNFVKRMQAKLEAKKAEKAAKEQQKEEAKQ